MAIFRFISRIYPKPGNRYGSLARSINYILNPAKTNGGKYTSSLNCSTETALNDMIETKEFYGKTSDSKRDRLAYHCELSWHPDEKIEYEDALRITREFCEEYLPGYEVVLGAHTDKAHCHVHIIFNSVNQQTGKKYRCNDGDVPKIIGPLVDDICKKHGFKTLYETNGVSWEEVEEERKTKNRRKPVIQSQSSTKLHRRNNYYDEKKTEFTKHDMVAADFDNAILEAKTLQEFYDLIKKMGYIITRQGFSKKRNENYFAVTGRGLDRSIRNYNLGSEYSIDNIEKRIEMKGKPLPVIPIEINCRYIIPFKYWKAPKRNLTDFEKRQYYKLYKAGIKPQNYYPSYHEIQKALKKIKNISDEIDVIEDNNLNDAESINNFYKEVNNDVKSLKEEKMNFYIERKPYMHLLNTYKKLKKCETGHFQYINGDDSSEKAHIEYLKCQSDLKKFGFSEIEIVKFQETLKYKLKDINRQLKDLQNKLSLVSEIKDDYSVKDPEYSQDKYNNIPAFYNKDRKITDKKEIR